jgi:hypothetical protein
MYDTNTPPAEPAHLQLPRGLHRRRRCGLRPGGLPGAGEAQAQGELVGAKGV